MSNKKEGKKVDTKAALKQDIIELARQQAEQQKSQQQQQLEGKMARPPIGPRNWQTMRVLWYSVAPFIKSGYGVVTNYMVSGMIQRGINTIIAAYYGIETGGFLKIGDMVVLPVDKYLEDKLGFNTTLKHFRKFQSDVLIYHTDFWVSKALADACPAAYCYTPIDHEDYPDQFQDVFRAYKGVASPSKHGVTEMGKYGVKAEYVPHGVDLRAYNPINKTEARKYFGIDPNAFVVGIVAANNDKEPRKGWDKMFAAIKEFLDNNPDAKKDFKVFVHTNPTDSKGYNLHQLSKRLNIGEHFLFQDPYMTTIGLPNTLMNKVYNSFNIMLNLSKREGFCIPMEEANACGIPCIATDFSAMPERVRNPECGWLVKPQGVHFSPINATTAIPDEHGAAKVLETAYNNPKLVERYSKRAVDHAKQFSWDIVLDKYMMVWLEKIAQDLPAFKKGKEEQFAKNIKMVEGYS